MENKTIKFFEFTKSAVLQAVGLRLRECVKVREFK